MIIQTTANTELLVKQSDELVPLLTINAWVLLPYEGRCPDKDFMGEMWKIINWNMVAKRLGCAKSDIKYAKSICDQVFDNFI